MHILRRNRVIEMGMAKGFSGRMIRTVSGQWRAMEMFTKVFHRKELIINFIRFHQSRLQVVVVFAFRIYCEAVRPKLAATVNWQLYYRENGLLLSGRKRIRCYKNEWKDRGEEKKIQYHSLLLWLFHKNPVKISRDMEVTVDDIDVSNIK